MVWKAAQIPHSPCVHIHLPPTNLDLPIKKNADVVFDLVLGKHGRELEKL